MVSLSDFIQAEQLGVISKAPWESTLQHLRDIISLMESYRIGCTVWFRSHEGVEAAVDLKSPAPIDRDSAGSTTR